MVWTKTGRRGEFQSTSPEVGSSKLLRLRRDAQGKRERVADGMDLCQLFDSESNEVRAPQGQQSNLTAVRLYSDCVNEAQYTRPFSSLRGSPGLLLDPP